MCIRDRTQLAFWPFDGLDINADAYHGRHVFAEIYCALYRPKSIAKSDCTDAYCTNQWLAEMDTQGHLTQLMCLRDKNKESQLRREGWIIGMQHSA